MELQLDATITVFIDLQDQLNMFRANICPSSGAQDLDFLQHMVQYPVKMENTIPEQIPGEPSPLFQLATEHNPHTTYRRQ
jgi:hypothetical protein